MCGKLHSTGIIVGTFYYIKVNQPIQTLNKYIRLLTMAKKQHIKCNKRFQYPEGTAVHLRVHKKTSLALFRNAKISCWKGIFGV